MKDFNQRFDSSIKRLAFWEKLRASLANIERQIRKAGHLTPEDVRVLKVIRQALSESYRRSETATEYHKRQLEKLRKEYVNES
jgi:hypothetical protein